jgi:hypothetical protein
LDQVDCTAAAVFAGSGYSASDSISLWTATALL